LNPGGRESISVSEQEKGEKEIKGVEGKKNMKKIMKSFCPSVY
jgi:hypothetical protein